MRKGRYDRAIREALTDALEKDPQVFVLGEDIGYGGVFGNTARLREKFGENRVFDTPLSENGILGHAIGAALAGRCPVAEIQFADFASVGFAPLTQYAASLHDRTGIGLPIVVRLPYGATGAGGPSHSQSPEAWFLNVPGLKLVFPSTPEDAYGLLRSAIEDPNPVLYFEHKRLYRMQEIIGSFAEPGEENEFIPFGKAVVRREGKDCLLVSYGWMVHLALKAAGILGSDHKIECSVLDLRTLIPLDREQLRKLAREIGRVVVIHEAPKDGGPGGWLAQVIREADQKVAVEVIGAKYTPIPSSPPLEKSYLPSAEEIIATVEKMVKGA